MAAGQLSNLAGQCRIMEVQRAAFSRGHVVAGGTFLSSFDSQIYKLHRSPRLRKLQKADLFDSKLATLQSRSQHSCTQTSLKSTREASFAPTTASGRPRGERDLPSTCRVIRKETGQLGGLQDKRTRGDRKALTICKVMGMASAQMKGLQDNIFICHTDNDCWVYGSDSGPLWGLTFAVKDMYDVEGVPTGFGNPTWKKTHEVPTKSAPLVDALLNSGATLLGKTVMDEMAFSLSGINKHYGTPVNPAAPGRIPGGSSSGSAAAVAAKLVDFAIGSDTAGSIRVPASHCGVLGMRPSHGRISMEGVRPLQPSLDTVGWFANDPKIFRTVGEVLLKGTSVLEDSTPSIDPSETLTEPMRRRRLKRWLVATDAFALADEAASRAIYEELSPHVNALSEMLSPPEEVTVASVPGLGSLADWADHAKTIQLYEAWREHGDWIRREEPKLGPGIQERFEAASKVTEEQWKEACVARSRFSAHVRSLVADGGVLAVPSAPGIAPLKRAPAEELDSYRSRILQLSVIAGPSGLPQVNLPIAQVDGCPVGFGLIAPRGWDEELLDLTVQIMEVVDARRPSKTEETEFQKFVVPLDS